MLNLPANALVARPEMERALMSAGQFVHVPEFEIRELLVEIYDENCRGNPNYVHAASNHCVKLYKQNELKDMFFCPYATPIAAMSKFGKTCLLCYGVGIRQGHDSLFKFHNILAFEHTLFVSGKKNITNPVPICDACLQSMKNRIYRVAKEAGENGTECIDAEIYWVDALAWLVQSAAFLKRVNMSIKWGLVSRHRFPLYTPTISPKAQ